MKRSKCALLFALAGCGGEPSAPPATPAPAPPPAAPTTPAFAMVIHGGAGAPPRDLAPEERAAYVASLEGVLSAGCAALDSGTGSLDVVERALRTLEVDPLFNAGRGAVMTRDGRHELDASIMAGSDHGCGTVASVRTVQNPITLARAVMEHTPHVLLVGEGAEAFALAQGMEPVDNSCFITDRRREQWEALRDAEHGTVGAVALDREGHLAAATSTGRLTMKQWGRVGDSPIIGAGTYADDATCAVPPIFACNSSRSQRRRSGTVAARARGSHGVCSFARGLVPDERSLGRLRAPPARGDLARPARARALHARRRRTAPAPAADPPPVGVPAPARPRSMNVLQRAPRS